MVLTANETQRGDGLSLANSNADDENTQHAPKATIAQGDVNRVAVALAGKITLESPSSPGKAQAPVIVDSNDIRATSTTYNSSGHGIFAVFSLSKRH